MGPLALACIGLPTVVVGSAGHPSVATIPTMGAGSDKSLVLANDDPFTAGNRCFFCGDWLKCQRFLVDDP